MTSILTNNSAMAALQTLRTIGTNMTDTQRQVSSGLRVQVAADNAAYWSISTTMRSDKMALSAVQDTLGLGAAKVDVAYAAMEASVDLVSEIRARIVSASEEAIDRSKLQGEISQLQAQLIAVSDSASFNGENWLKAPVAYNTSVGIKTGITGSFTRDSQGNVSVQKIDYMLDAHSVLFDTDNDGMKNGILDFETQFGGVLTAKFPLKYEDGSTGYFDTGFMTTEFINSTYGLHPDAYDFKTMSYNGKTFSVISNEGDEYPMMIEFEPGKWAYTDTSPLYNESSFSPAIPVLELWGTGIYPSQADPSSYPYHEPLIFSVSTLDLTAIDRVLVPSLRDDALKVMLNFVEQQMGRLVSATAKLGALSSRITMQQDFATVLQDSISKGIGRLVDADMNEASIRLKALQTQQQLAIQSLSIANTNGENIRQLFQ